MNEVTREEFDRFKRAVIKKLKAQEELISDAFKAVADLQDKEDDLVDEALDRATRAQRAVRRLEKRVGEIENG